MLDGRLDDRVDVVRVARDGGEVRADAERRARAAFKLQAPVAIAAAVDADVLAREIMPDDVQRALAHAADPLVRCQQLIDRRRPIGGDGNRRRHFARQDPEGVAAVFKVDADPKRALVNSAAHGVAVGQHCLFPIALHVARFRYLAVRRRGLRFGGLPQLEAFALARVSGLAVVVPAAGAAAVASPAGAAPARALRRGRPRRRGGGGIRLTRRRRRRRGSRRIRTRTAGRAFH